MVKAYHESLLLYILFGVLPPRARLATSRPTPFPLWRAVRAAGHLSCMRRSHELFLGRISSCSSWARTSTACRSQSPDAGDASSTESWRPTWRLGLLPRKARCDGPLFRSMSCS
eukprot:6207478-Pleurochrysis_carterae.AAC.1